MITTNEFALTRRACRSVMGAESWRRSRRFFLPLIAATVLALLFFLWFDYSNGGLTIIFWGIPFVILTTVWIALVVWGLPWLHVLLTLNRSAFEPRRCSLDGQVFTQHAASGTEERLSLSSFARIERLRDYYILRVDSSSAYVIPTSAFSSADDLRRFEEALSCLDASQ